MLSRWPTWIVATVVALAGGWLSPARSAELKPMVVVSLASFETIQGDLAWLGKLSDQPDLAPSLEAAAGRLTQSEPLPGIDRKRPGGAAVLTDAEHFEVRPVLFIPVDDLSALLKALEPYVGVPQPKADGILTIQAGPIPLFVRLQNRWAYVAQKEQDLRDLPDDPTTWLDVMQQQYRVAARIHVQNVPEAYREIFQQSAPLYVNQLLYSAIDQNGLPLEPLLPLVAARVETFAQQMHDLETVSFGLAMDVPSGEARLEIIQTALPETPLLKLLTGDSALPNHVSGLTAVAGAVQGHLNVQLSESESALVVDRIKRMRPRVADELAREKDLSDEALRKQVAELIDALLAQLEASAVKGRLNAGLSLTGDGPYTLLAAACVADGRACEKPLLALAQLLLASGDGVTFVAVPAVNNQSLHTASVPVSTLRALAPDIDDDQARLLAERLGDPVPVAVVFAPESVWLAIGDSAPKFLSNAAAASMNPQPGRPPLRLDLAVSDLIRLVPEEERRQRHIEILNILATEPNKDHVRIEVAAVERSQAYRLVVEQGLLKALAQLGGEQLSQSKP